MAKKKNVNPSAVMRNLLSMPPGGEYDEKLSALGLKKADRTNAAVVMAAVFEKAAKGEISAVKELFEIIGETENDSGSTELSRLYKALESDDK